MIRTLHELAEYLVDLVLLEPLVSSNPPKERARRAIERGEEIPESAKPGYIIKSLPDELREMVKKLNWKHFWHRVAK